MGYRHYTLENPEDLITLKKYFVAKETARIIRELSRTLSQ
jgi:hypothetical protein